MRTPTLTRIVLATLDRRTLASACSPAARTRRDDIPEPTGVAQKTMAVSIYFSTGRTLVEEPRVIDGGPNRYYAALDEVLNATPQMDDNKGIAIVQPETRPKSVKIDDKGVVTVDWPKNVLDFEADDREERLAFASILMTLGQFDEAKKVRFTVEGKDKGTIGGKKIEDFWGSIGLQGQPYDVIRAPAKPSEEATGSEVMTGVARGRRQEGAVARRASSKLLKGPLGAPSSCGQLPALACDADPAVLQSPNPEGSLSKESSP